MRHYNKENKNAERPVSIRPVFWVVIFGLMLPCLFLIDLSRRRANLPTSEAASEDVSDHDSSTRRKGRVGRIGDHEFRIEVYEPGARSDDGEAQFLLIGQMIQDRRTWVMDTPR